MKVKVSVIIPAYNAARTLPRCLKSIQAQYEQNWECIVVNDGSTDNTAEIIERYAMLDSRIRVITQANCGVSAARNCGLKHAIGEYVTFVDSDDYVELDYFQSALSAIDCYGAVLLMSGYVTEYYNEGWTTPKPLNCSWLSSAYCACAQDVYLVDRSRCASLLFDNSASYWGYIRNWYRLSVIRDAGLCFDVNLTYNEDRAFTLAYLAVEPLDAINVVLNRPNYHYVMREGSAMTQGFNAGHLTELESFIRFSGMERKYFRDYRLNIAIRYAGLVRKHYLTWLAMNMERYDTEIAEAMTQIERRLLRARDFLPPYTSQSRAMMKRWLQFHKYLLMKPFSKLR